MYPHEAANQAHTQGHHTYSREKGYEASEYKPQEYPKALEGGKIVASAEEETAFRDAEETAAAKTAEEAKAKEEKK